jgi:peptidoglycan/xylan/chitin deacetylase (PgdA/CDA1 family)/spore germination protein YaaH
MRNEDFVFYDARGRRWFHFKALAYTGSILGLVGFVLFLNALFVAPSLNSPNSLEVLKRQIRAYEKKAYVAPERRSNRVLAKIQSQAKSHREEKRSRVAAPEIRAAFFTGWDDASIRSLKEHQQELTHVCPEWLSFTDPAQGITEDPDVDMEEIPMSKSCALLPVLSNLDGSTRVPEGVETLMRATTKDKEAFVGELKKLLIKAGAKGVVIDWEEVDHGEENELSQLVSFIADRLHAAGLETWLCVTMDATFAEWDFDLLSGHVDRFVALLHDENGEGDPPGPLASIDWFDGWMEVINKSSEPSQWIASLGSYGADWEEGTSGCEQISFADVMSRAGNAGCENFHNEGPEFNGHFSYFFEGKAHDVWFLDAASFANQLNTVRAYGLGGIAINRLGLEDPAIWNILKSGVNAKEESIPAGYAITSIGKGEIVSVDPTVLDGKRVFSTDVEGRVSCIYKIPPAFPTLFRQGGVQENYVSITFDDGPDPRWTPQILDILKKHGVHATFFVVGQQAELYPGIVQRMVAEGHEIGNHSFTHPNLAEQPERIIELQLNATQRLLEALTGRSTILFRPPFNADSRPSKLEELKPIKVAQSLGYLTVLENIDPRDWMRPDANELLRRVKAARADGKVILLHDGGGDRRTTVEALPALIDYLKERGDRIVTIGELLGIPHDRIMPPLTAEQKTVHVVASGVGFHILHWLQKFLRAILLVGTVLVVARTLLVLFLARRYQPPPERDIQPPPFGLCDRACLQ